MPYLCEGRHLRLPIIVKRPFDRTLGEENVFFWKDYRGYFRF